MDLLMGSGRYFVLVVDSDSHRGRVRASQLRAIGCYAACSTTGEEAFKYIVDNDPDALLSDWDLSDMTGLELARRIKMGSPQMKIILQKERADWRTLRQALECGGDELLSRPFSTEHFVRMLGRKLKQALRIEAVPQPV